MVYEQFEEDARYTLTPFEKGEVLALKKRCDEEGVDYRSLFELAKYTMVSVSIKDEKKRQEDSFSRLKKKRAFEKKHNLTEINLLEAVTELEENQPEWAISCGKVNDKWCVGYTSSSSNPTYMSKAVNTIFKVELERFDLAAADLEEARKGFYIVGTGKDLRANPLKSIKVAISLRGLFAPMHANRVKGIYYEVPRSVSILSNMFLAVLPSKMKERMNLGRNLKDMKLFKQFKDECEANLPSKLGGTFKQSLHDWVKERSAYRKKTDELVTIE